MNNKSFSDGVQFAWDATSITTAMTCPRKYYYSMIRGIEPLNTSVHLIFGGLYASALEHFYKYRAEGASLDDALFRIVKETLLASWPETGPIQFDHPAKTRFGLIRSLIWYVDQFGAESTDGIQTVHLDNGKPAVELSFSFEVSDDIIFCGHLDRVVTYAGQTFVMDQKTTGGTIGPYFFDGFKPDNQMSMYTLAGQIIMRSPVKGVLIDGAQIAVGFTRFERGFTYRTASELEEWRESALHVVNLTRSYTTLNKFPMNLTACGNYGGCPFKRICSAPPEHRNSVILSEYKSRIWDPLDRR
jgi:hypothetical protein